MAGWNEIALSGHSVKSMITTCQAGEQSAESAYLDALEANPAGQTHSMLEKHCEQIKGFYTRLTRLIGEIKDGVEFQKNDQIDDRERREGTPRAHC